jgi:hypothetical protein
VSAFGLADSSGSMNRRQRHWMTSLICAIVCSCNERPESHSESLSEDVTALAGQCRHKRVDAI